MAKRGSPPPGRQGYHHGNLKEALVEAARGLIAERGPAGFTLAEAARLAGVSAAAPYRHVKDRDALIAEVAARGFAAFAERLAAAWSATKEPSAGFAQMGEAYLRFAREEPGYYGAMFAGSAASSLRAPAGDPAFAALQGAIGRLAEGSDKTAAGRARALAFQVWAFAHGIAMLSRNGLIPADEPSLRPEILLRDGVSAWLKAGAGDAPASNDVSRRRSPSRRSAGDAAPPG